MLCQTLKTAVVIKAVKIFFKDLDVQSNLLPTNFNPR